MSNSYKHTSITGNTMSESEKVWKKQAHRKKRRIVKMWLSKMINFDLLTLFDVRDVSSTWDAPKDGRHYFDQEKYPQLMRK